MQTQRFELKFPLPSSHKAELLDALRPHVQPDPHAGGSYTVHSIYFDSSTLRFYHEKIDGRGVRRKLRIRTYMGLGTTPRGYFEIKRKIGRSVLKERVDVERHELEGALNGKAETIMHGRPYLDRRTLERFRFGIKTLDLFPSVLVAYEREAWIGRDDRRLRVTFDRDLRSCVQPDLDALCCEEDLRHFEHREILELKFDQRPPKWLTRFMNQFHLRPTPYSKYCQGIDAWTRSSAL